MLSAEVACRTVQARITTPIHAERFIIEGDSAIRVKAWSGH
jgi:hypothetical protein